MFSIFHDEHLINDQAHEAFRTRYDLLRKNPDENKDSPLKDSLVRFIKGWTKFATSFGYVMTKEKARFALASEKSALAIDQMARMDRQLVMVPVLVSSHIGRSGNDDSQFEQIAQWSEVFTFRAYGVAANNINAHGKAITRLAHEIYNNPGSRQNQVHENIGRWLVDLSATMPQVLEILGNKEAKYPGGRVGSSRVQGWKRKRLFYFLYEYNRTISGRGEAPPPWVESQNDQFASIEHILPQTHESVEWWTGRWKDKDEADRYKHRLGNLCLTLDNRLLGNKSFPDKLDDSTAPHYYNKDGATASERELKNFANELPRVPDDPDSEKEPVWLSEQINEREKKLLRFAADRWAFPCECDNVPVAIPYPDGSTLDITNPQHTNLPATEEEDDGSDSA